MNADQFISYLEDPKLLDKNSSNDLQALIAQYPYFQTAHLLFLKNLHIQKSVHYPNQLKIASSYANDRKKLYQVVMQEDLHQQIKEVESLSVKKEDKTKKSSISPLEEQILQAAVNASIQLEVKPEYSDIGLKKTLNKDEEKEEIPKLEIKKPLSKDGSPRSFSEWLKSINQESQRGDEFYKESKEIHQQSEDLINNFIQDRSQLGGSTSVSAKKKPQAFFSPIETAKLGLIDDESFVTETLAKIYEAQGFHLKAKTAYEILSLKFPEKKTTFAPLISSLERLIKTETKGKE